MRLIDADAYIAYCEERWIPLNVDAVKAQPTVKRKRGRWLDNYLEGPPGMRPVLISCSECNKTLFVKTKFCPNCGADMREK